MKELLEKSFDFSVRITELIKYLEQEEKNFPLRERLLECAAGAGVCLRQSGGGPSPQRMQRALDYLSEADYLLELLSKTEYLTERQGARILEDCRTLKGMIMTWADRQNDAPSPERKSNTSICEEEWL